MDIGKEKEKIIVEPIKDPVPRRDDPEPEPSQPDPEREPVKVPADQNGEAGWKRSTAGVWYRKRTAVASDWTPANDYKEGDIF